MGDSTIDLRTRRRRADPANNRQRFCCYHRARREQPRRCRSPTPIRTMTIRRRVWLNLAIVNAFALALAAIAWWVTRETTYAVAWSAGAHAHRDAALHASVGMESLVRTLAQLLLKDSSRSDVQPLLEKCDAALEGLRAAAEAEWLVDDDVIEGDDTDERKRFEQIISDYSALRGGVVRVLDAVEAGRWEEAMAEYQSVVRPRFDSLLATAAIQIESEGEEIDAQYDEVTRLARWIAWTVAVGCALLVLTTLSGLVALSPLSRSVMLKIETLVEATRALSAGKLDHRIPELGEDELGVLAGHFNEMADRLRAQRSELEKAQCNLREVSRQAGRAEIATSVLHNVGNALNSASVSANVAVEHVRKSKAADLHPAIQMLTDHQNDLGAFLSEGDRGLQMATYLARLSDCLDQERKTIGEEMTALLGSLAHIKNLVAKQQQYARYAGLVEIVNLPELIEDALKMDGGWVGASGCRVERDYAELEPIATDRHRLMEILLNLFSNSRHSLKSSSRGDRRLTLRIEADPDHVRIVVRDNGVGISPENLSRIFSYGFTTKPTGHGFGLHGASLAASDLGGKIEVHSDGRGQGATFTLELPRRHQEMVL